MVDDMADIPEKDAVRPALGGSLSVLEDIVEGGEAEVHLQGHDETGELHSYDTHFYHDIGWVYTNGWGGDDDADQWFPATDIIRIERH